MGRNEGREIMTESEERDVERKEDTERDKGRSHDREKLGGVTVEKHGVRPH